MRTILSASLLVLAACGGSPSGPESTNCAISFCGCWEDVTQSFSARVLDASGAPVDKATVTCHGDATPIATAGPDGRVSFTIATKKSPGCGYEGCRNLLFAAPGGSPSLEQTEFQSNGKDVQLP